MTVKLWLPENTPILIVHGTHDDIVPVAHSRTLATAGTPGLVEYVEVNDSHRFAFFSLSGKSRMKSEGERTKRQEGDQGKSERKKEGGETLAKKKTERE